METKALKFTLIELTEDGQFTGHAAAYTKDRGNDIIKPGAFKRTIDHSGGRVPILWFHNPTEPIGLSAEMTEDQKGLFTRGQLDLDIEQGRRVRSGMQKGYIDCLSIGYEPVKHTYDRKQEARILEEVKLYEYSPLTKGFSMNQDALISGVKSLPDLLNQFPKDGLAQEDLAQAISALKALLWRLEAKAILPDGNPALDAKQEASAKATLQSILDSLKPSN